MNNKYCTGPIVAAILQSKELYAFKNKKRELFQTLTSRELEVLKLTAEGKSNPIIAEKLKISRITVQNHRSNIRRKLQISSETDYFKYALAFEIIPFFESHPQNKNAIFN